MKRREFITLLGGAAVGWSLAARAQQLTTPVFGILLVFSQEAGRTFVDPLRAYMNALGYVEGRNIVFEVRYADGKVDRLPALAAELVAQAARGDSNFRRRHCSRRQSCYHHDSDRVYVGRPGAGENRHQHATTGGQHHRRPSMMQVRERSRAGLPVLAHRLDE